MLKQKQRPIFTAQYHRFRAYGVGVGHTAEAKTLLLPSTPSDSQEQSPLLDQSTMLKNHYALPQTTGSIDQRSSLSQVDLLSGRLEHVDEKFDIAREFMALHGS